MSASMIVDQPLQQLLVVLNLGLGAGCELKPFVVLHLCLVDAVDRSLAGTADHSAAIHLRSKRPTGTVRRRQARWWRVRALRH